MKHQDKVSVKDPLKELLDTPPATSWAALVGRSQQIEKLVKELGKQVDRNKCQVKRGIIETEVQWLRGQVEV